MPNDADRQAAEVYRDRHGLNGLNRDHLTEVFAYIRLAAYQQGQRDMQERAAQWCDTAKLPPTSNPIEIAIVRGAEKALQNASEAIRALPIKELSDEA
jgi:hypothetical protein